MHRSGFFTTLLMHSLQHLFSSSSSFVGKPDFWVESFLLALLSPEYWEATARPSAHRFLVFSFTIWPVPRVPLREGWVTMDLTECTGVAGAPRPAGFHGFSMSQFQTRVARGGAIGAVTGQFQLSIGVCFPLLGSVSSWDREELQCLLLLEHRDVVSTGPLALGHLIWPPGHLLLDSTGPDWPPTFKT